MKIHIQERPEQREIQVTILCPQADGHVRRLCQALEAADAKLVCRQGQQVFSLDTRQLLYAESLEGKTFLYTEDQVFQTKDPLYALEEALERRSFFRASKSVLINLTRVQALRPEMGGRLLATMDNQEKLLVSRRYARAIKDALEVF